MHIDPIYNVRATRYLYTKQLNNGLYVNAEG